MHIKLPFQKVYILFHFTFLLTLFFSSTGVNAQCAGNDNAITICDIANPSSQAVNLFALLGGTPTAGGIWSDDLLSGGLNTATGVLNVQTINESGVYTYTYTVSGVPGCVDNTAVITVTVGGYAGVPGPNGTECGDSSSYNLFQLFNGTSGNLSPQFNGNWFNVTTGTPISGSSINPSSYNVTVGTTYQFSYTMPAIGTCPATSVSAFLTIFPPAEAGIPTDLVLCETADLSIYTNLNLYNLLTGEDGGGRCTENSGTSEIGFPADSFINVQNIYNTLGPGTYTFTYTVLPTNPICPIERATVAIIIERRLDLTGATLVVNSDICESEIPTATYNAILSQGVQAIPNGNYNLVYQVSGQASPVTITGVFNGGVMSFPISSLNFQQVGTYTITILSLTIPTSLGACQNIIGTLNDTLTISPTPTATNAVLFIADVCQNDVANVQLSNATGLPDGTYLITYNLSGANTAIGQTQIITVSGGVSNFTIPGSLLSNAGATTCTITSMTSQSSTCNGAVTIATNFTVKPIPVVPNLGITVSNSCFNQSVPVTITGLGALTSVTLNYDLTGTNTSLGNIITLPVTAGNASFILPQGALSNTGLTTITITNLANPGNTCGVVVSNISASFTINTLPTAPTVNDQTFCKADNATVAQLLPSGNQYSWYASAGSTAELSTATVLVSGNYYVSQTDSVTGCESTRTMIAVTIDELETPTLNQNGAQFCALDNPTLQELSNNTNSSATIVWYDAASGGNQLPNTTLLQEGVTYYGFDLSSVTNCSSENPLEATISLSNCDVPVDFFIPDGFSPNGDGVNDAFVIPNIEFVYPNYTIEIYNRYGNLLFEGNKNKANWDGRNSTSKNIADGVASNGVYFYIVYFNKDNRAPKQGRLYLNR